MKIKIGLGIGAVVVIVLAVGVWTYKTFTVKLPTYPPIQEVVWLDQNWTPEERDWFHSADQGTQTFSIPYEWFMALEQPSLSLTSAPGLLSDPVYLDRFGFIPSNKDVAHSHLPVGFAHGGPMRDLNGGPWRNPQTNADMTAIGLTCAACHTGRFTYQHTTVLVDGAPALTNLKEFQKGVAFSLLYLRYIPFRFDRFEERVLGSGASDQAKSSLRKQLDPVVSQVWKIIKLEKGVQSQTVDEGYARLDALTRIGNIVFSVDLGKPDNYVGYSAPVHFPRIWNSSWFLWVQYNGSIEQPMTRNAGEALGVGAKLNLTGVNEAPFSSGVRVDELFEMERMLSGSFPNPPCSGTPLHCQFNGLQSPTWPVFLPPVNLNLAAKGAGLYKSICEECHMSPVNEPTFWISPQWSAVNAAGERYLDLEMIDIKHVGTDPAQAEDMNQRRVFIPPSLGITTNEFGPALGKIVENVVTHWYDSQQPPTPQPSREQMNGYRPAGARALLKYKVRPLNGIWATPPYLHNGSVPNLYALLSPAEERPKKFWLGNREYDPVNVGYRSEEFPDGFKFDTTIRGNWNSGHEFTNDTSRAGRINRYLEPDERRALIEYLKTL
jgi:hypothetical protein